MNKMKLCSTEPVWMVYLNTLNKYGHDGTISSYYCEKHLLNFRKQVEDFNLKVRTEFTRIGATNGLTQQEWKEFVLLFAIEWSASKFSRAQFIQAMSTDVFGNKTSKAERERSMAMFVCRGQENANFTSHIREISDFVHSGR